MNTLPPGEPRKVGKFRGLLEKYGKAFLAYYVAAWFFTGVSLFGALQLDVVNYFTIVKSAKRAATITGLGGFVDIERLDTIDPVCGKLGLAVAVNEIIDPLRILFCIATINPLLRVMKR